MHMALIDKMLPEFVKYLPDKQVRLLDVGCGQGYACTKFKEIGYENITAITLSSADIEATQKRGFTCYQR